MNNNLYILMIYIGAGLIVSGIVLWTNWLSLSERAHLIALIYTALFITMLWGLFIILPIVVIVSDFLNSRWPLKQVGSWWDRQFEQ